MKQILIDITTCYSCPAKEGNGWNGYWCNELDRNIDPNAYKIDPDCPLPDKEETE